MKPDWQTDDGRIQLYCGDCMKLMKNISDKNIDMILCDLPYGITACKWDKIIPFESLWKQYKRIIKNTGVVALTASQPFASALVMSNMKMFKYEWIWNKTSGANFLNLKNRPWKTQEQVLIFSLSSNFIFNPIRVNRSEKSLIRDVPGTIRKIKQGKSIAEHYNFQTDYSGISNPDGMRHPIDIINFSPHEKDRYKLKHPTKKPVALFEYLIKTYTNKDDLILDNCFGSGTTGIACIRTRRRFIGIEISPEYFEIAKNRIKLELQQQLLSL